MSPFGHGKATAVYANGVDLSAFLNSVGVSGTADLAETSCFGSTYKSFVAGLLDSKMSLGGYFSSAAAAVDETLSPLLGADVYLTVLPQGDVIASRGRAMHGVEINYEISAGLDGASTIAMEAASKYGAEPIVVNTAKAAKTATGNDAAGVVSPTGAATTNGWTAWLQCFAIAGTDSPTCAVKLQDSTDDSSWLDVADGDHFVTLSAANANVPGAQRIVGAAGSTLRKFTRFLWTITGTNPSFTIACAHVRG
jgi:hypothetical protein